MGFVVGNVECHAAAYAYLLVPHRLSMSPIASFSKCTHGDRDIEVIRRAFQTHHLRLSCNFRIRMQTASARTYTYRAN